MEPLSIALAIAKATGADEWLLDKLQGNKAASKVLDLVAKVTGSNDAQDNLKALERDPQLNSQVSLLLIENRHEIELAAYQDRADARAMYKQHPAQADKIAERIMRWNLPYIAFLLLMNCVAIHYFKDNGALLAAVSNVLGMAIKSLFDERKEVSGFYFGGSMSSSPDNGKQTND